MARKGSRRKSSGRKKDKKPAALNIKDFFTTIVFLATFFRKVDADEATDEAEYAECKEEQIKGEAFVKQVKEARSFIKNFMSVFQCTLKEVSPEIKAGQNGTAMTHLATFKAAAAEPGLDIKMKQFEKDSKRLNAIKTSSRNRCSTPGSCVETLFSCGPTCAVPNFRKTIHKISCWTTSFVVSVIVFSSLIFSFVLGYFGLILELTCGITLASPVPFYALAVVLCYLHVFLLLEFIHGTYLLFSGSINCAGSIVMKMWDKICKGCIACSPCASKDDTEEETAT